MPMRAVSFNGSTRYACSPLVEAQRTIPGKPSPKDECVDGKTGRDRIIEFHSRGVPVDTPLLFLYNLSILFNISITRGCDVMEVDEIRRVRLDKVKNLEEHQIAPYGMRFDRTHSISGILENFEEGKEVVIAGRFMSHRSHGKVMFADLEDQTGKIQIFIKVKEVMTNGFEVVKALDIGDIIGIKGALFVTKTGQQSVRVAEITFLCKSLLPLP